ncbi:MAG: DUF1566 domain-containing protein [Candidatus Nealsonbacteria bacterium]|nr:DUF1566 domain-containing protein [Candidatus Nealsonbacteria bacterium]
MFKPNQKSYKILIAIGSVAIAAIVGCSIVWAGSLNPTGAPGDTMKTLDDIYCAMKIDCTSTSYGLDSPASPTSTMHTLQEIYDLAVRFPLPDTGATTSYGASPDDADYTSTNSFACDMSFTDNGDETIIDNCTGLMWDKCSQGLSGSSCTTGTATTTFWEEAKVSCENSTSSNYSDWRLPNVKELMSIVNHGRYGQSIDPAYFPATVSGNYWSATTYKNNTAYAWFVYFFNGYVYGSLKASVSYFARCVRGQ